MTATFNLVYGNKRYASSFTSFSGTGPYYWAVGAPFKSQVAGGFSPHFVLVYIANDDTGTISAGKSNVSHIYWQEKRRVADTYAQCDFTLYDLYLYANQSCDITTNNGDMRVMPGVTITGNIHHIWYSQRLDATGLVTGNITGFNFDSFGALNGTIGGSYYPIYISFTSSNTLVSVTNLVPFYSVWDISGVQICTGYSAVLSADINADTRTFSVYGSRIDIDGTMGAGAVWRGHYLNATGVTCGANQFFYGLDIDFTGMGVGGTIAAINVLTATNVPVMRFPLATGNSIITTGDVAGVARSIVFNMPVVAGGAAAAGLSWLFKLDSVTEAGLIAETDGAGTYRLPLFKIPNYSADYGVAWAAPPAPAPAGLVNGCMFIAHNTNGNLYRMYCYTNAGWHYVVLT